MGSESSSQAANLPALSASSGLAAGGTRGDGAYCYFIIF